MIIKEGNSEARGENSQFFLSSSATETSSHDNLYLWKHERKKCY